MTIGIVADGPNIALKVVDALSRAEQFAGGAIGGFVTMVVFDEHNQPHYFDTQNGGVTALQGRVAELQGSQRIGLISSGAWRPEPLSRFLAWDEQGNIVSGHRFPQLLISSGEALNQRLLSEIQDRGINAEQLDGLLAEHPDLDAGFVAIDKLGGLYQQDCAMLSERDDTAAGLVCTKTCSIALTMNSIAPAELVKDFIIGSVTRPEQELGAICLNSDTELRVAPSNKLFVDAAGQVIRAELNDQRCFAPYYEGSLFLKGTKVYNPQGLYGMTADEPYVVCTHGRISFLCVEQGKDGAEQLSLNCEVVA
ncbi:DUF6963 family protein [Aliagarivorans taiwanensis]|uniref:DUF6963 family protein n=1 Tax=Aliagarivorans taiwanensis TaxID=561966 RepID=UPI00040BEF76|nr:hypothetical protein [Aliagarivorans taiwanensis]